MGTPKQLLKFRDRSLLRHAAQSAVSADLDPILVVLGADAEMLQVELNGLPVRCATNPDWKKGIGTSIRCGIGQLGGNITAVVIMLCDQPLADQDVIRRIIEAHRTTGSQIVASGYDGAWGVPALFTQAYFEKLASLPDNVGAKSVIEQAAAAVHQVDFPEGAIDVDTPADYQHLSHGGAGFPGSRAVDNPSCR